MSDKRFILIVGLLAAFFAGFMHAQAHAQAINPLAVSRSYTVVDTGQDKCYNAVGTEISCPAQGKAFYGQDAQYTGNQPSYTLSADGLTVHDNVTGLTWTQSPDLDGNGIINVNDKLTFSEAQSYPDMLNSRNYGGYSDWRLPTIKELYSLIDFRGTDVSGRNTGDIPFIDTDYFAYGYGDTAAGERLIDSQFWSSNVYVGTVFVNEPATFGLNLADGRIKGYPSSDRLNKLNYVYFVRGNTSYGVNNFTDNGDGTVTDSATGLMWSQDDSGASLNWEEALAWVAQKNAEKYLGYSDWRLPDAKEMQSIVDYSRAPDATGTAAIDPVFNTTQITNEAGQADYPYFWTGTTHVQSGGNGEAGVYICFGRAMGYMNGIWMDVHGAGAQRCDFKSGDPADYPPGHGPQGDVIRIYNYVRCVRSASSAAAPVPDIKANGSDGFLTISSRDVLSVSLTLDPGSLSGAEADWWVAAYVEEAGWWACAYPDAWSEGLSPFAQTELYPMSSTVVLNATLPSGQYTFYFAVDANADGEPDADWWDSVEVEVTDP